MPYVFFGLQNSKKVKLLCNSKNSIFSSIVCIHVTVSTFILVFDYTNLCLKDSGQLIKDMRITLEE